MTRRESTGMTRKKALISYVSDKKDDVMPVPRHWHPGFHDHQNVVF
ncbi:hypothetical protein [Wolbachia endosymbiont (group B) of Germaria angustata]